MLAYGLARVLKETFGLRTYVREGDAGENVVEVHDSLEPDRLRALQEFAESQGWEVGTRYDYAGQLVELTAVEDLSNREEVNA